MMIKKGVLVLILLLIFLSAATENSYARNTPRLIDEQDNLHPWGGDDSNSGDSKPDNYDPISPGDYSLQFNYGSKTSLISGLFMTAWDEMRYLFFGINATPQPRRDRSSDGSPTSSGFTQPDSGSSGGRSGF